MAAGEVKGLEGTMVEAVAEMKEPRGNAATDLIMMRVGAEPLHHPGTLRNALQK
jgi:hypothetical protein